MKWSTSRLLLLENPQLLSNKMSSRVKKLTLRLGAALIRASQRCGSITRKTFTHPMKLQKPLSMLTIPVAPLTALLLSSGWSREWQLMLVDSAITLTSWSKSYLRAHSPVQILAKVVTRLRWSLISTTLGWIVQKRRKREALRCHFPLRTCTCNRVYRPLATADTLQTNISLRLSAPMMVAPAAQMYQTQVCQWQLYQLWTHNALVSSHQTDGCPWNSVSSS